MASGDKNNAETTAIVVEFTIFGVTELKTDINHADLVQVQHLSAEKWGDEKELFKMALIIVGSVGFVVIEMNRVITDVGNAISLSQYARDEKGLITKFSK